MRILVVGGGGREHALCWALVPTATVFCAPGNPGTKHTATSLAIDVKDHRAVIDAMKQNEIDMAVIGPEAPLAAGLVDDIQQAGLRAFGPSAKAAQIEASKAFAKTIMTNASVPTAITETFTNRNEALAYIESHAEPLVVKASGLAAGKGAVVCDTRAEASAAASDMFGGRFGEAGNTVLIEDFLIGEELSVFVITDGERTVTLPASQDHKRLLEQDKGPNTGGMGAYCPVSIATPDLMDRISNEVVNPTLREMASVGSPFRGVLYVGLMIAPDGAPSVVEFNCRFGDPEAQVVLPACTADWAEMFWNVADDTFAPPHPTIVASQCAVTTVLAAEGYPSSPKKGAVIKIPEHLPTNTLLFHAGTDSRNGEIVATGGRVLAATGIGDTVGNAAAASVALANAIQFDGKVLRRDIAWRETRRLQAGG